MLKIDIFELTRISDANGDVMEGKDLECNKSIVFYGGIKGYGTIFVLKFEFLAMETFIPRVLSHRN